MAWIKLPDKKKDTRPPTQDKKDRLKFYNSRDWRILRQKKIKESPLCEYCLSKGRVEPAREIHHLQKWFPFKTEEVRWNMFTDWDNLYSVCSSCHSHLDTDGEAESIEIYNKRKLDATNKDS